MTRRQTVLLASAVAFLFAALATAQWWDGSDDREQRIHFTESGPGQPRVRVDEDTMSTAREVLAHSTDVPMWTNAPGFEKDAFSFCRVRFVSGSFNRRRSSQGSWITDFPDSDMNLSFRLQQMTSMKVEPSGRFLRLNNEDLFNYPWIYMVEPGRLQLDESEVKTLRDYLLNGGFLMADDFWGETQWQNFSQEMKKLFPDREFIELDMTHPIFHTVFDITVPKQKLQTPNWYQAYLSLQPGHPEFGITWEDRAGYGAEEMHVRAILDDKGRIMVIATHNCDNGDGWEREGQNDDFFQNFSEKRAFPLGINIIVYAMTH